jgi:hypothetical protein
MWAVIEFLGTPVNTWALWVAAGAVAIGFVWNYYQTHREARRQLSVALDEAGRSILHFFALEAEVDPDPKKKAEVKAAIVGAVGYELAYTLDISCAEIELIRNWIWKPADGRNEAEVRSVLENRVFPAVQERRRYLTSRVIAGRLPRVNDCPEQPPRLPGGG